jgi:hypothetical protein
MEVGLDHETGEGEGKFMWGRPSEVNQGLSEYKLSLLCLTSATTHPPVEHRHREFDKGMDGESTLLLISVGGLDKLNSPKFQSKSQE